MLLRVLSGALVSLGGLSVATDANPELYRRMFSSVATDANPELYRRMFSRKWLDSLQSVSLHFVEASEGYTRPCAAEPELADPLIPNNIPKNQLSHSLLPRKSVIVDGAS
jgi:hypothetical protein